MKLTFVYQRRDGGNVLFIRGKTPGHNPGDAELSLMSESLLESNEHDVDLYAFRGCLRGHVEEYTPQIEFKLNEGAA